MKIKQLLKSKRAKHFLIFCALFSTQFALAQVDAKITTWGAKINLALKAAVAVFAAVGGFLVFLQYMQGNDQAQKNFIKFVIGLAIFALVTAISGTFV